MRTPVRAVVVPTFAAFAVLAATAIASPEEAVSSSADSPRSGGTAVVAVDLEPACLNVLRSNCNVAPAWAAAGVALPGAFRITPSFSYEPMLVDSVDVGRNPFTLTYHIKEAAIWSDGRPVSSDDFLFTLAVIRDVRNNVVTRAGYDLIADAVEVDEKTARFVFTRPYAAWRTLFPTILPRHVLEGTDFNQIWQTEIADPRTHEPIGSGPFLVTNWVRGQAITLSRNPRWWGPHPPLLASVVIRPILDSNGRFQAFVTGEVSVMAPQPELRVADLRRLPDTTVESDVGLALEHLDFNVGSTTMPLLREPWFRRAVAFALDREPLFPLLFGAISPNLGAQHSLSYPSTHDDYEPAFARYVYSPDTVAAIMQSHECVRGPDTIWSCGDVRASVKFATTTGNQLRVLTQQELQTKARAAGIELVPDNSPGGDLFGRRLPTRDYELIMFTWVALNADPLGQVDKYGCGGSQNFMAYCSETVTDLLSRAETELDPIARAALVNEANAILAEDVPTIPLFRRPTFLAYKTRLHGPRNNPAAPAPTWNVEDWCFVGSCDVAAPSTAAAVSRPPNAHGWNSTPVTVELTADDGGGSGVQEISYRLSGAEVRTAVVTGNRATVTVAAEGVTTLTYFARDRAGNVESTRTLTLRIDLTPPQVSATRTPGPNANGWNNEDVTVRFEGMDALSGIDGEPAAEVVLREEGAGQSVGRSFADRAGNRASASVSGVNIDRTAPQVAATRMPGPNAKGWNNEDVTVRFEAMDALSGIDGEPAAELVLREEGAGQSVGRSFADRAGNRATASVFGISIDKTAPLVHGSRTPGPNPHGWNNEDVTVRFEAMDALSGIDGEPEAEVVLREEGAGQSVGRSFADRAGNRASASVSGVNIDRTAPLVAATRTPGPNANGWNNEDVTVRFEATDALSAIDGESNSEVVLRDEGASQSAGRSFSDRAGNRASASVSGINIDKTGPSVSCDASPGVLWPPNHRLVDVEATVAVTDALSGAAGFALVSVTSNEPDDGPAADVPDDAQEFAVGTADTSGQLRAERAALGSGRVYTLVYEGADRADNTSTCSARVAVPHDRSSGR